MQIFCIFTKKKSMKMFFFPTANIVNREVYNNSIDGIGAFTVLLSFHKKS